MDFNQIARELIPLLGGKENIASAAHCATRLRLVLVDDSLADQQAIGKVDGVKGCFRNARSSALPAYSPTSLCRSFPRLWRPVC